MIFSLSKVREDLIEDIIKEVKDNFDKNYKDKLNNLFYKCPQLGISDTQILVKLTTEYFQIINKCLQNIFEDIIKLQDELNIRYNNKEIDSIKKLLISFTDSSNEKFLLFIVCEQISLKTHTKELDIDYINKIENNTSSCIKREIHHLILVIAKEKDKPEIVYQKKAYKVSILSIRLSIVAITVSLIASLIVILKLI